MSEEWLAMVLIVVEVVRKDDEPMDAARKCCSSAKCVWTYRPRVVGSKRLEFSRHSSSLTNCTMFFWQTVQKPPST